MRFFSFGDRGERIAVLVSDSEAVELTGLLPGDFTGQLSPMRRMIERYESLVPEIAAKAISDDRITIAGLSLAPPVPDPSKVIAAPVNYVDHMEEMSQDSHIDSLGVFLKAPSSVLAAGGVVRLPYTDRRFDQEGELALVIGRRARNVAVADALHFIFGYTCLLDITMRGGEDRSTRKSFDSFTPMGPYLVTADEVGDLDSLELKCTVSGDLRQKVMIEDLIWGVPELVAYASSVMTLLPGDVITTGTPKGVGPLQDGDSVTVEISRVGSLSVNVSADGAGLSPTKGANRGPVPPPAKERG